MIIECEYWPNDAVTIVDANIQARVIEVRIGQAYRPFYRVSYFDEDKHVIELDLYADELSACQRNPKNIVMQNAGTKI